MLQEGLTIVLMGTELDLWALHGRMQLDPGGPPKARLHPMRLDKTPDSSR